MCFEKNKTKHSSPTPESTMRNKLKNLESEVRPFGSISGPSWISCYCKKDKGPFWDSVSFWVHEEAYKNDLWP